MQGLSVKPHCVVCTGGFPAVTQTFVLREIRDLLDAGWRVTVVAPRSEGGDDWSQAKSFGIGPELVHVTDWRRTAAVSGLLSVWRPELRHSADFRRYGRVLGLRRVGFFAELKRRFQGERVDLVHCHFVQWGLEVGMGLARVLQVPLTVIAHDGHLGSYANVELAALQAAAAKVYCVSNAWRDLWIKKTGQAHRLEVLSNAVDPEEYITTRERAVDECPQIAVVASCNEGKRPFDIIAICEELRRRGAQFRCTVVGGGPLLERLQQEVIGRRLMDVLEFVGARDHADVRRLLSRADVFVHTSERESFGLSALEAMASGVPTVVSRTGGAADVVDEGKTGFTCEIGAVDQFVSNVERLLVDRELNSRMRLAGRERAIEKFSWCVRSERLLSSFAELAGAGSKAVLKGANGLSDRSG